MGEKDSGQARPETGKTKDFGEPGVGGGGVPSEVFYSPGGSFRHPERVGPFRILDCLGEGGMGAVYLAEQTEPIRRRVALKVILPGMDTREVIGRFETERQALAIMSHPHIARVYEAGATETGRPYFVMEHVPGLPITDYCDLHRLTVRERLELVIPVCEAVQHAHQKAIIHRDLKPSNVLVMVQDGKPWPKIIDFGVAKATDHRLTEKTLFTERGRIIGTPEYMSPEQAEMGAMDVDTRTDIYSLGVLLYELLVGALPFDSKELRASTYSEIQRKIREVDPPRPSTRLRDLAADGPAKAEKRRADPVALVRQVRGDLDWITMKAMEKDRTRRYASAAELAADLFRHLRHEPVLAGPPSTAYRLKKFVRRNRSWLGTAAIAAVLLAAFLAAAWWHRLGEAAAERTRRMGEGRRLFREAQEENARFFDAVARRADLKGRWQSIFTPSSPDASKDHWRPFWERVEEIAAWKEFSGIDRSIGARFIQGVVLYDKAMDLLPPDSPDASLVSAAKMDFLQKLRKGTSLILSTEDLVKIGSQGLGDVPWESWSRGRVSFEIEPSADEVYCFRIESHEERLLPVPFHPRKGVAGNPILVIERAEHRGDCPFEAGDRLVEVNGVEVNVPGDLARALAKVGEDQPVSAAISGKKEPRTWTPFPGKKGAPAEAGPFVPGRVIDFPRQFGFSLCGYPLDFRPECRLEGGTGSAVEVELPRGEYVIVFRKAGFADTRYPIAVPEDSGRRKVSLLKSEEVPEGFVYVPAGRLITGTDEGAYDGLGPGEVQVAGFLMARREVTFREYLEFLNDPEVSKGIDGEGKSPAGPDWSKDELRRFKPEGDRVQLVPLMRGNAGSPLLILSAESGRWEPGRGVKSLDWPVLGVSLQAAAEYARWLTAVKMKKTGLVFRLPRETEWERAARGPSRRVFVWGDYPLWSYCKSAKGTIRGPAAPDRVELYSTDESVFGIRDLAGSVSEPTLSPADPALRRCVLKGGSWETTDDRDFRIQSRNRRAPEMSWEDAGIRIVAEVPPGR